MEEFLKFDHVSKSYGSLKAVNDVTLTINRGEIFSILGPSGCGKTTLLRMLAGFESPDSGRILLDGSCPPDTGIHRDADAPERFLYLSHQPLTPFATEAFRPRYALV